MMQAYPAEKRMLRSARQAYLLIYPSSTEIGCRQVSHVLLNLQRIHLASEHTDSPPTYSDSAELHAEQILVSDMVACIPVVKMSNPNVCRNVVTKKTCDANSTECYKGAIFDTANCS